MNDEYMSQMLLAYLEKEYAHESYVFYKNVEVFKKKFSQDLDVSKSRAKKMYEQFVKEGGADQINIPSGMVSKITAAMEGSEKLTPEVFDDAAKEVVTMLARDKVPRFLNTEVVKERKELYERCVKLSSRVDAMEKKGATSAAAVKGGKSPGKDKKSPRKTLKRDEDRSNLSGLLEDALLGNVTR